MKVIAIPRSGYLAIIAVNTAVMMTVIGPVGSEIRLEEPPNREANSPTMIAPHSPASAPAPDATPKRQRQWQWNNRGGYPAKYIPFKVYIFKTTS